MEAPISFGLWLKERRKQLDLTQADLANCVGCSAMTIRKIEADERRPSRQIAELIAGCLGISPEDRPTFLKVARAELRVDRLGRIPAVSSPFSAAEGQPLVQTVASPPGLAAPLSNIPAPLTP